MSIVSNEHMGTAPIDARANGEEPRVNGHVHTGTPGLLTRTPDVSPKVKTVATQARPKAKGKFLFVGDELYVKGAIYGAFRPDDRGREYQDLRRIGADFAQMAANGFNAVRIPHTVPPRHLLDVAFRHGLRVMLGLSAEQFVGYLIDRKQAPDIEQTVQSKVRAVTGHPALLCAARPERNRSRRFRLGNGRLRYPGA
jgi:hypothetical protein